MRHSALIFALASIFALSIGSGFSSAESLLLPSKINIYCTNNFDGTGQCFETKTNTLLKCTGVPGDIIPCRIPGGATYNCIFFSAALLACNQVVATSVEERANKIQNRSPFQGDFEDVFNEPLIDPTDRLKSGNADQPKTINTEKPPTKTPTQQNTPIIMPTW